MASYYFKICNITLYSIYEFIFQYLVNFLLHLIKYLFFSFLFIHTIPSYSKQKIITLFPSETYLNDMI